MDEAAVQVDVRSFLEQSFDEVSMSEFGGLMIWLPDNPAKCEIQVLEGGTVIVKIESPVLMDVPPPPQEMFELICLLQREIEFGSLVVISNSVGEMHLAVQAKLLAGQLTQDMLSTAVRLVHKAALNEISRFQSLTPPVGGATAYST